MDKNRVAPDRLLTQETEFLLRLGGKEGKELEVFSSAGKCDLPDGYPAALPADRVGHAVASSQKKPRVFMCGGYSPKTTSVDRVNSVSKTCYVLDIQTNQWSQLPSLKVGVSYATAVYFGSLLLLIGGYRGHQKVDKIQVFDTMKMQWSVFPTRYPFGVYGHCSVISEDGGSIHSSGGWSDNEEALNSAFVLELGDNTVSASSRWEKVSPMRVGRSTHACLPTKYKEREQAIVVAGGLLAGNGGPTSSVEVFFFSKNAWEPLGDLVWPRAWYPSLAVFDHKLYCIGGKLQQSDSGEVLSRRGWRPTSSMRTQVVRNDARGVLLKSSDNFVGCR